MKPTRRTVELKIAGLESTIRLSPPSAQLQRKQIMEIVQDGTLLPEQAAEMIQTLGGHHDTRTISRIRELFALANERHQQVQTL